MALDTILEKLHEERDRLAKELSRVVKMIRAAGRGAEAAIREYGRRNTAQRRAKGRPGAAKKRTLSAASRKKMAEAQRARRLGERTAGAKNAPKGKAAKARTAKTRTPTM